MLITFSGMVGSGKSTAAKHVAERLGAAGVECQYLRFRSLDLLPLRKTQKTPVPERAGAESTPRRRWAGFQPRTLTTTVACGYALRILAYRLFGPRKPSHGCILLDRYFYDSFVHYRLETRMERVCLSLLRRLIPVPDMAILIVASSETISKRRPDYASEYVTRAGDAYGRLSAQFPHLIEVRTDPGESPLQMLDTLLHDRLATSGSYSDYTARGGVQ